MLEKFGNFVEPDRGREFFIISFSASKRPFQQRWKTNSLSAEFLAEYWGTFFPVTRPSEVESHNEIRDAVSYITNELLENALKFNCNASSDVICIGIYLVSSDLFFYITNSISDKDADSFRPYIERLLCEDISSLYLDRIERNAAEGGEEFSRLGLLTILNDYNAELAWKFEKPDETCDAYRVTTMVRLAVTRGDEMSDQNV